MVVWVDFLFVCFCLSVFLFLEESWNASVLIKWKKASYIANYPCAVNKQRGRDLQDFTQNFICLYVFLSQKKLNLAGNCTGTHVCWDNHWCEPRTCTSRNRRRIQCVAEDITQRDFGKKRSSNCDTERHCSKSLRTGVEQKECECNWISAYIIIFLLPVQIQ